MADHMYKMSEVPKGKRFAQFLDYYKFHTLAVIIGIIAVASLCKTIFFTPQNDICILTASSTYVDTATWDNMQRDIEALQLDTNGDGKYIVSINPNIIDESEAETNPEYYAASQQRFLATLAAGDHPLQIVDEKMYEYLLSERLIGTYSDLEGFSADGETANEYIKIPLSETGIFSEETLKNLYGDFYLTLRGRDSMRLNSKKKLDAYNAQAEFVASLAEPDRPETVY